MCLFKVTNELLSIHFLCTHLGTQLVLRTQVSSDWSPPEWPCHRCACYLSLYLSAVRLLFEEYMCFLFKKKKKKPVFRAQFQV